ncbi:extracellular solute-binding protein (plasmid) [Agrobacterium leguminum]|nr:extracellular solute-binding protein [Agrobacterium leguminum]WLE00779.1 extracellular solute-binding protein [Agrobacterium leguminum]
MKTWLLAGCVSVSALISTPVLAQNLRVMFGGDDQWIAGIQAAAKAFEKENSGVTVQLLHTPYGGYPEKVASMASSNDLPDVMQLDAPYLSNYVWSGLLQPIEPLVDPKIIADMTPSNISQSTYPIDGKLYATGLFDSTVVLYANKKYLESIGARIPKSVDDAWTRDEFEKILSDLSKLKGVQWPIDLFRSAGSKSEWVTYAFSPIFQSMGCDLINRSTWVAKGTLDSAACVDAGSMIQNWASKGWVVPGTAAGNVFYADGEKAALAWGSRTYYAEAVTKMGDNVVALPLPKFGEKVVSPNGTQIWGVTKTAKEAALAGKFIGFLLNNADYREAARKKSSTPGLRSFLAESPLYQPKGPMAIGMEQAEKSAVARPGHPAYPAITEAFKSAMDGIFAGSDAKSELTKAAAAIDLEIEDNDGFPPFNANSK